MTVSTSCSSPGCPLQLRRPSPAASRCQRGRVAWLSSMAFLPRSGPQEAEASRAPDGSPSPTAQAQKEQCSPAPAPAPVASRRRPLHAQGGDCRSGNRSRRAVSCPGAGTRQAVRQTGWKIRPPPSAPQEPDLGALAGARAFAAWGEAGGGAAEPPSAWSSASAQSPRPSPAGPKPRAFCPLCKAPESCCLSHRTLSGVPLPLPLMLQLSSYGGISGRTCLPLGYGTPTAHSPGHRAPGLPVPSGPSHRCGGH